MFGKLENVNHSQKRLTPPYPFSWLVANIFYMVCIQVA